MSIYRQQAEQSDPGESLEDYWADLERKPIPPPPTERQLLIERILSRTERPIEVSTEELRELLQGCRYFFERIPSPDETFFLCGVPVRFRP